MTKFAVLLTASAIALGGAASAMTNPAAGFEGFVTAEQAVQLDDRTIASIKNVINSSDSRGERAAVVNALVKRALN